MRLNQVFVFEAFQRLYEWVSGFFICAKGQADFYWDFHGCKSSDTRKDIINELSCKETGLPFISKKTTLLEDGTFVRYIFRDSEDV